MFFEIVFKISNKTSCSKMILTQCTFISVINTAAHWCLTKKTQTDQYHVITSRQIVPLTYQPAAYGSPEDFFSSSGNSFSMSYQNYFVSSENWWKKVFSGIIFLNFRFFYFSSVKIQKSKFTQFVQEKLFFHLVSNIKMLLARITL